MGWVFFATAIAYSLASLPIWYSLLRVQKWRGIGELWGYAPNQFLFIAAVFPFAAVYTFLALRVLIVDVRNQFPSSDPARFLLDNWSAWLVLGLSLVSVIAVVVYFAAGMSMDKLKPPFSRMALDSVSRFEDRLARFPESERPTRRAAYLRSARIEASEETPPVGDDEAQTARWLAGQEPEVILQFLMNPRSQLRLQLLEPTVHSLNVFQLVASLFVAATALACTLLTLYAARKTGFPEVPNGGIAEAVRLLSYSLVFFALYPLLYNATRLQAQDLVGQGYNVLQDVLAALAVLAVFLVLNSVMPPQKLLSFETAAKYFPFVVVSGGFAAGQLAPGIWRQLVGRDTTWGIQAILVILFSVGASIPLVREIFFSKVR